jgi:ankyrin repeat protein
MIMKYVFPLLAAFASLLRPASAALPSPVEFGIAVEAGNTALVRAWLDEGLPPDYMADRIGSGLMVAAWNGHLELIRLFLDRGADVHLVNAFDEQALQLAAWRGHVDAVRLLLERGAAVNREGRRWGALHYAVFAGHEEIARLLIASGADVNARTPNGSTALMLAAREGHGELARALLAAGADLRAVNEWGDDALAFAMRHKHYGIAKMVSRPDEFAKAVKQPEVFGAAQKSVPAPPEIGEILEKIRRAQAEGKPTEALRRALHAVIALHRHDSEVQTLKTKKGKGGKPEVLVITARRDESGRERAELLYEAVKAGAALTTPARAASGADGPSEISEILDRLQKEKGEKGRKRSAAELRKALYDAVARFKQEAQAEAAR